MHQVVASTELPVKPHELLVGHRAEFRRRGRADHAHPRLEHLAPTAAAKAHRHRHDHLLIEPPHPAAHLRALQRIAADEVWIGMQLFEILADDGGFGQPRAIGEFEHRQGLEDVGFGKGGSAVFAGDDIEMAPLNLDALLDEEHAHEARIWAKTGIELHRWDS